MSETMTMTIGALAKAAGIGVETVRFYERKDAVELARRFNAYRWGEALTGPAVR